MDKQSQPENVPECFESNRSPNPDDRTTAFEVVPIPPAFAASRDVYPVHRRTFTTRDIGGRLLFETPCPEFGNSDPGCSTWSAPPWICAGGNEEHGSKDVLGTGDFFSGFKCMRVPVNVENPQCVVEIRQKSVYTPDARESASYESWEGGAREPPAVNIGFLPENSRPRQPDETSVELVSAALVPFNLGYSIAAPNTSMSVVSTADPEGNSRKKVFACSICTQTFRHKYKVLEHERNHTGERPFSCDLCEKRFMTYQVFKRHRSTHTKNKPFKCSECDDNFTYKYNLRRHIQSFHS